MAHQDEDWPGREDFEAEPWKHHDMAKLAASWATARLVAVEDLPEEMLAGAWLFAASQGFVAPGGLPGDAIPARPDGEEKLRARRYFLHMVSGRADQGGDADLPLVLDAVAAAPPSWRTFRMTPRFLERYLKKAHRGFTTIPKMADRHVYLLAWIGQHRART